MGGHKITIEIISNPQISVLRPQSYTLQNTANIPMFYTQNELVKN